ncbi:phosphate acyltransferase [Pontibacillus litoralis]|uniref:Phosphate acetyl/butyryl transferase n=1 Tax=Pontibacillus litoralis JSM 072002 TaxID=1385512 RepID=A0A0A5G6S5_9BACI|nr:phosphate acyltransferase [Pontibacillus litoralis]KGX87749.1 phosphate acetyl/butyryl transferase [Pontibacillus litoralis JSM 072002]
MVRNFHELEQSLMKQEEEMQRVAVVKAASSSALESVFELAKQGLIVPFLIDDQAMLDPLLMNMDIDHTSYHIVHVESDEEAAFKGVELVRNGECGFIMKGNIQTGTLLKQVVNRETGIRKRDVLSHLALIETPHYPRFIGVTDGGMLLSPNVDQKESIINNATEVMQALGYKQPKFAVLSAAEVVQPKLQPSVDAEELTKRFEPSENCIVEGPLSLDLALFPAIAAEKQYKGRIQGDADVLVAADVVNGNTLSKSMILLGNGAMAGLIIGAQAPIILTSRSSTAEEKRRSLLLALQISRANARKEC